MLHIVARLVVTHVAHHVARHATHQVVNQVAQHATHHVVHHAVNAVTTAHQTAQNAGTLQKVAQAGTLLGVVNSGAGLYTKIKHDRDARQQKEQEKQAIRNQIQTLQQQLANLEK